MGVALCAALVLGLLPSSQTAVAAAPASLTVVGQNSLGGRGMNAALAIAEHCAYVGSRNEAGALVVDISNPAAPQVFGQSRLTPGALPGSSEPMHRSTSSRSCTTT